MTNETSRLKFYTDTHIAKAVAVQLRQRGIQVVRCEEVGLAEADDTEHLEYAAAHGLTLVSHDRDFWELHSQWLAQGLWHSGIVLFSRQFQGDIGKYVTELETLYQMIAGEAGTLEKDVHNQIYAIDR